MVVDRLIRVLPEAYLLLRAVWLAPSTLYDAIRNPGVPNSRGVGDILPTKWSSQVEGLRLVPATVTEKYSSQPAPAFSPVQPIAWPDCMIWPSWTATRLR